MAFLNKTSVIKQTKCSKINILKKLEHLDSFGYVKIIRNNDEKKYYLEMSFLETCLNTNVIIYLFVLLNFKMTIII